MRRLKPQLQVIFCIKTTLIVIDYFMFFSILIGWTIHSKANVVDVAVTIIKNQKSRLILINKNMEVPHWKKANSNFLSVYNKLA